MPSYMFLKNLMKISVLNGIYHNYYNVAMCRATDRQGTLCREAGAIISVGVKPAARYISPQFAQSSPKCRW